MLSDSTKRDLDDTRKKIRTSISTIVSPDELSRSVSRDVVTLLFRGLLAGPHDLM